MPDRETWWADVKNVKPHPGLLKNDFSVPSINVEPFKINLMSETLMHFKEHAGLIALITSGALRWRCCFLKSETKREN